MVEQLRAPDSSYGVPDQQRVGSSPGHEICVLKQDIIASSFGWDVKLLVLYVVERT